MAAIEDQGSRSAKWPSTFLCIEGESILPHVNFDIFNVIKIYAVEIGGTIVFVVMLPKPFGMKFDLKRSRLSNAGRATYSSDLRNS